MYIAFVFIADGRPSLFAGVLTGLLLLEIILLLSLVFIPKVTELSNNPHVASICIPLATLHLKLYFLHVKELHIRRIHAQLII